MTVVPAANVKGEVSADPMDEISCLVFDLDQFRYAVEAGSVVEVMSFPPLRLLPDAPPYVIGAADRDGEAVPVIDLDLLLGHPVQPSHATDQVIVLRGRGRLFGLLAQTVLGTRMLPDHGSVRTQAPGGQKPQGWRFVSGLVAIEHSLVMLLDSDALQSGLEEQEAGAAKPTLAELAEDLQAPEPEPRPAAGPPEAADPADRLADALFEDFSSQALVAVIGWEGRRYGAPLHQIDEFTELTRLTELPGCPQHIWGQAVIRGEIVTVVDVRRLLREDRLRRRMPVTVVLVRPEEERIAIVVDEVQEMVTVSGLDAAPPGSPAHVIGTVQYAGESLDVLDLLALLSSPEMVVDQSSLILSMESARFQG